MVYMIYLDFSKTFDKVDHGLLLHKFKDLGITGNLAIWFYNGMFGSSWELALVDNKSVPY